MSSITGTISQFAGEEQYKILRLKISMLSTSLGDNFVCLKNENDVSVIENFIKPHERVYLIGRRFMKKKDMYTYPLPFASLNELLVSNLSANPGSFPITSIMCMAFKIPVTIRNSGYYFTCP